MNTKNQKFTQLSELGEFKLISKLTENIKLQNKSTIKGIGDDAAIIDNKAQQTVITTDLLVEGIHFNLMYANLKYLGYKAVVVNLSDIFAMNATPKQITVSIAVSDRFSYEALKELYKGINLACEIYKVDLIGGDTSSSKKGMLISVTAIGVADKEKIVYRNTAQNNDLICVSGDLGAAYMGLQLLERETKIFELTPEVQPDFSGNEYIIERQLKPEARGDIIRKLAENNILPTSMIDISDGLSSEILHICNSSKKGCKIYEENLPIAQQTLDMASELNIDPTVAAMNGGEDYELLFTANINEHEKIKTIPEIHIIGHITDDYPHIDLIARNNTPVPIIAQGWNTMDKK